MKRINFFQALSKNQDGVAILMVITAVTLLSFILADFTFETKLNKLKVYNSMDKMQARLNAESGLRFALAKLALYKEGMNLLEKTENAKDILSPNMLENIITEPFYFPPPIPKKANVIQREAVEEFLKNTMLTGSVMVEIFPQSGFLNPNNMRLPKATEADNALPQNDPKGNGPSMTAADMYADKKEEDKDKDKTPIHQMIEKELTDMLKESLQRERENNESYDEIYPNAEPEMLIKELKYYVNNNDDFQDSERGEIEGRYLSAQITPKHAPLTSPSEMYLLAGWNDALVDLIKDRLTVHLVSIIPLNTLTLKQLKVIFPSITDDQNVEFFRYRDGNKTKGKGEESDEDRAHPFKSEAQFKQYIVNELKVIDEAGYDKRIAELNSAGIKLGAAGKLFKVIVKGEVNNASYTITAFVDLPIKPEPPKKKKDNNNPNLPPGQNPNDPSMGANPTGSGKDPNKKEKAPPMELLAPRVIEIMIS
ncbi:MAG: hypothetical protein WCG27_09485 [Pseudomonadota bacterium]